MIGLHWRVRRQARNRTPLQGNGFVFIDLYKPWHSWPCIASKKFVRNWVFLHNTLLYIQYVLLHRNILLHNILYVYIYIYIIIYNFYTYWNQYWSWSFGFCQVTMFDDAPGPLDAAGNKSQTPLGGWRRHISTRRAKWRTRLVKTTSSLSFLHTGWLCI